MSRVSPEAAFDQWIEDVQASAQLLPGVEHLESTLEHVRRSAVTEYVDREFAVARRGDLTQDWPPGAVEILEYVLRDARWPELETLLQEVRNGAEDFRHRDLARQVLEVYDEDWPGGEIYRRYREASRRASSIVVSSSDGGSPERRRNSSGSRPDAD